MDISGDKQMMDFLRSSVSPENSSSQLEFSILSEEKGLNATAAARKRFLAFTTAKRTPTLKKVEEAILAIGSSKNGASFVAITEWILCNYEIIDYFQLKIQIKRAILKGLEQGILLRNKSSKNAPGIRGRFILPQKQTKLRKNASKAKPKKTHRKRSQRKLLTSRIKK
ncbi:uncharacterized protein LOC118204590 isoform X1 [Stegodyphus dumicola]|uniref:uncharacterized protein LOC118204590 isoform X1 n=1 Tax=Stegodyphus dumicola TaxID=202533 RepID=UPI0015ADC917|nr:uncharacterized protein LOC118204590 isoform X1 [Stegodyphus dumicola]